jgi:uncharacterized protein (DUF1810 family)
MSKFTPGPWVHKGYGAIVGGPAEEYVNGSAQQQIAMCFGPRLAKDEDPVETRDANARLIAAAPDMYEALRAVVDNYYNGEGDEQSVARLARAVLAKVEG